MRTFTCNSLALFCLLMLCTSAIRADDPPALAAEISHADREFFESRIRPVLIDNCYSCHNSASKSEAGLALDWAGGIAKGGASGSLINRADPSNSLLLRTIRHEIDDLRMPREGGRLSQQVVADIEKWIRMGLPDPRTAAPTAEQIAQTTSWPAVRNRRMQWWSFQPIANPQPPEVGIDGVDHPIDRFIVARLQEANLQLSPHADRATLLRRVTFALTGLPPTPLEIEQFLNDPSSDAYEKVVDRLLRSPRFGERWARHWMDWYRFAETHGSEGDPAIPYAWQYRDYLIRALNDDVPYDQLIREHIAGDLLRQPRIHPDTNLNESAIATSQYRLVFHGFAPTDALDELVRTRDNQIDVLTKATMGLTVSCARCHNHKFDPISQADFYALYGILDSTRPGIINVTDPKSQRQVLPDLQKAKVALRDAMATAWLQILDERTQQIEQFIPSDNKARQEMLGNPMHGLRPLVRIATMNDVAPAWQQLRTEYEASAQRLDEHEHRNYPARWKLGIPADAVAWNRYGIGLENAPASAGGFAIASQGANILTDIYPAGIYSHLLSTKHNGLLTSPSIMLAEDSPVILVRVAGDKGAHSRYVIQNYPRNGTVYPVRNENGGQWNWIRWDTAYWSGDRAHLEFATAADSPVLARGEMQSWFGITEAVIVSNEQVKNGQFPRNEMAEVLEPLFTVAGDTAIAPKNLADVAGLYRAALAKSIEAWQNESMTDAQARFLSSMLRSGVLPNRIDALPWVEPLLKQVRELERQVPVPARAPGVIEAEPADHPLFVRGDHKQPGPIVPRRFLEAFDDQPYETDRSGRLELAESITDQNNPLTARVMVNRIWHHLFGQGIVRTVDNFGLLGEQPSHPMLLDYLAQQIEANDGSIKQLIRSIVLSETYRQQTANTSHNSDVDAENRLLSSFPVRRLEAEAIRDSLLALSGRLDLRMHGASDGPDSRRRSIYLRVQRNDMHPFLTAFDFPEPSNTKGQRDATNVPSQSLTMLNDGFVTQQAEIWASRIANDPSLRSPKQQIQRMYMQAMGRLPTEAEVLQCEQFIDSLAAQQATQKQKMQGLSQAAADAQQQLSEFLQPIRATLLSQQDAEQPLGPAPIAHWSFDKDFSDSIGSLHGQAKGRAAISDGALVLDGDSHVLTPAVGHALGEKTLAAWVSLHDLDQRGGGVLTVQTLNGATFDSIVFGERDPKQWLAGSNGFQRTQPFGGTAEQSATTDPVHIALVYEQDGTIRAYRNGKGYGRAYKSAGLQTYAANAFHFAFGIRHAPAGGNRMLKGRIHSASVFNRALAADEIAAIASGDGTYISETKLLTAMTESQQQQYRQRKQRLASYEQQLRENRVQLEYWLDENLPMRELAHGLLNTKEFLYLR